MLVDFRGSLRAAKKGDEDAFASIWREFHPGLIRYLRVKAASDAEDLASDTWCRVTRALGSFEGDEVGFRAWLYTSARNRLTDWYRGSHRQPDAIELSMLMILPARNNVESEAEENSATDAAVALIAQLPTDQAEAVMLRIVAGLDVATVAKIANGLEGSAAVAASRAPIEPTSPVHFGSAGHRPTGSNATQTSFNRAGYAVTGPAFSNVAGSWTEPTASCPSKQAQEAAFWVGIDGFSASDPTVEQIGTDSDCAKGRGGKVGGPRYYACYQMFPQPVVVLSPFVYPVAPGDSINASVSASGLTYTLTISDGSRWRYSMNQTSRTQPRNSSAEWIAETPTSCSARCKPLPLADFGSMAFTGASANHQVISASGFTNYQITMTTKNSRAIRAQPSALGFGGSVFAVTWHHN